MVFIIFVRLNGVLTMNIQELRNMFPQETNTFSYLLDDWDTLYRQVDRIARRCQMYQQQLQHQIQRH